MLIAGLEMNRAPSMQEFRAQTEQLRIVQSHLTLLWDIRLACGAADYEAFVREALSLAELTGTKVESTLKPDGRVSMQVSKTVGVETRTVSGTDFTHRSVPTDLEEICGMFQT